MRLDRDLPGPQSLWWLIVVILFSATYGLAYYCVVSVDLIEHDLYRIERDTALENRSLLYGREKELSRPSPRRTNLPSRQRNQRTDAGSEGAVQEPREAQELAGS